jgi:glycerophosphoryl diester phosphodiesterase
LLVEVIERTEMRGRVLVQSFDIEALQALRALAPEIPRGALTRSRGSFARMVESTGASVLLPKMRALRPEDVATFHARGVAVIPWVVNDPDEIRRMIAWGVDGIITDRPDLALEVRDSEGGSGSRRD